MLIAKWEWTDEYLPALVDLCVKRREGNLERWKENGGRVGMSEWDFLARVGESSQSLRD